MNRRSFLGTCAAAAGAFAAAPLLASCGTSGAGGAGTTSASELAKIMPAYVPGNLIKPDFASVSGSSPGYLNYPATLVHTVHETPGAGGSYTGITPLWASIPSPNGNTYYEAVNKALGATLTMQPSNGNTYNAILPPLFSGNKLPDWIQIPSFWTGPLDFGQAVRPSSLISLLTWRATRSSSTRTWQPSSRAPGRQPSGTTRSTASRSSPPSSRSPATSITVRTSWTSSASAHHT